MQKEGIPHIRMSEYTVLFLYMYIYNRKKVFRVARGILRSKSQKWQASKNENAIATRLCNETIFCKSARPNSGIIDHRIHFCFNFIVFLRYIRKHSVRLHTSDPFKPYTILVFTGIGINMYPWRFDIATNQSFRIRMDVLLVLRVTCLMSRFGI